MKESTLAAIGAILLIALLFLVGPFITAWAWNTTMPYIFGLKTIGWVQAFALQLLGGIVRAVTTVNRKD